MTGQEILESAAVLTMTEVAMVLKLHHQRGAKAGQPDRRLAVELVNSNRLRLVDPKQPPWRWTVAASELRRYLDSTVQASA